jgi:hypothetical protein
MEAVLSGLRAVSCVVYVMEVGGCMLLNLLNLISKLKIKKIS